MKKTIIKPEDIPHKIIEYVEYEDEPRITLVAFPKNDKILIGFSIKHETEDKSFIKSKGVEYAIGRAIKWENKTSTRYGKRLILIDDIYKVPDIIHEIYNVYLPQFLKRCKQYYKDSINGDKIPKWILNEVPYDLAS